MLNRDNLFCKPHFPLDDFTFDAQVAAVFPDMLQRSIPGYQAILNTIGLLARRFIQPNSQVYDLGCSLGAAAFVIYHNLSVPGCNIIAIDNSTAMVNACQQQIDRAGTHQTMRVIEADIQSIKLENAAMAVLNFTLQFVDPKQRQGLLNRIYQGLNPGGILILSEKLRSADRNSEQLLDDLHLDFKRANGYSELEISQKRAALERVMQIDSAATHQHRLRQAGFSQITRWFHYLNFGSFIALKACS